MERLGRLQDRVRARALLAVLSLICCQNYALSSPIALWESCTQRLEPEASAVLSASFDWWEQRHQRRAASATKEAFLQQAACLLRGPGGGYSAGGRQHEAAGLHEGSAVEVEIARRGSASQSSTAGILGVTCPAKAAIDGLTLGFDPSLWAGHVTPVAQRLLQAYPVSQTKGKKGGSWWALDLEEAVVVTSVEAWPPRFVDEAVRTDVMEANGRNRKKAKAEADESRAKKGGKRRPGGPLSMTPEMQTTLAGGRVAVKPRSLWASLSLEGREAAGVEWEQELSWGHTWAALQLFQPARRLTLMPAAGTAAAKDQQRQGGGGGLSIAEVRVHAVVPWECQRYCVHGSCQCTGGPEKDPSECARTFCACEPDWAGLQCDTFVSSAWEHLPRSLPSVSAGPSPWWEASGLSSSLTRRVSELQQPRGCPAALVSYPDLMQSGLGSTLMLMSAALSDAVVQGRTFVPPESVQFASRARECKGRRGFECYFKPWANLDVSCKKQGLQAPENRVGGTACPNGEPSCSRMDVTAAPYSAMGRFWWRAHLMEYLMRMSKGLRRSLDLEALKQRIGFQGPIIGVHIRHGDSCFLARSGYCRPVSDYIPPVLSAAARYNISRAFVATDDPAVVRELRARAETDGIEWLFLPINRESLDVSKPSAGSGWKMSVEKRMRRGELPVYQTTQASLQDVLLLAESDVLIGTGSASFFKVALLLSAARKRALPPYVSLDAAYCDSWRMCCDVMPDGSSVTC